MFWYQQVTVGGFAFVCIPLYSWVNAHAQLEIPPHGAPGAGNSCSLHIFVSEIFPCRQLAFLSLLAVGRIMEVTQR